MNIVMVERWASLLLARALIFCRSSNSFAKGEEILNPLLSLNQSLTIPNSRTNNTIDLVCDGLIYGVSSDLKDCEEAVDFLSPLM